MSSEVEKKTINNTTIEDRKDVTVPIIDEIKDTPPVPSEPEQDDTEDYATPCQWAITEIKTSELFSSLFTRNPTVLESIEKDMQENSFDSAHPLVLWNDVIVDGHCRYDAAKKLKIEDVWAVSIGFTDEDEAIEYAIRSQRDRRNLTDADRYHLILQLDKRDKRGRKPQQDNGDTNKAENNANSGKSATRTAKLVDVSPSTVEHVRRIADKASPEVRDKVQAGNMTINEAYKTVAETTPAKAKRKRKAGPDYKGILKALTQAIKCCDSDKELAEAITKVIDQAQKQQAKSKAKEQVDDTVKKKKHTKRKVK